MSVNGIRALRVVVYVALTAFFFAKVYQSVKKLNAEEITTSHDSVNTACRRLK